MLNKQRAGFTIIETMIVLAIASAILAMLFLIIPGVRDRLRRHQANTNLSTMVEMINVARQYSGNKQLRLITGSGCSDCVCRAPASMTDSACISNWNNARTKISNSGGDISYIDLDPWGDPYALDENEGESGPMDCRPDTIRSAGADGVLATADDISRSIPLSHNPCP